MKKTRNAKKLNLGLNTAEELTRPGLKMLEGQEKIIKLVEAKVRSHQKE